MRVAGNLTDVLGKYHPVFIEGMGGGDNRDPCDVANRIVTLLHEHWRRRPPADKPKLVITQGDPPTERGIAAITRLVASDLGVQRCLVCLGDDIDPNHAINADKENTVHEVRYSQLVGFLNDEHQSNIVARLTDALDRRLQEKNRLRVEQGKPPLKEYCRDYALLQEVSKAVFRKICGGVTVAHTSADIDEFSVTSFFDVGLELGLVDCEDIVSYHGYISR